MGTYLNINILNATDRKARKFNNLWLEFSKDLIDPEQHQNFYSNKIGPVLHFQTEEDLTRWTEDSIKTGDMSHLGITATTTVKKAKSILKIIFKSWAGIGVTQIKLSGSHYCFHLLKRIQEFLAKYPDDLEFDDEGGSLERFVSYQEAVVTSSYCRKCQEMAKVLDIPLPVFKDENCKNSMYEDDYKNWVAKIDNYLHENQNFTGEG